MHGLIKYRNVPLMTGIINSYSVGAQCAANKANQGLEEGGPDIKAQSMGSTRQGIDCW